MSIDHDGELDVSGGCNDTKYLYLQEKETGRPVRLTLGCGKRYDCYCPHCANRWRKRNRARYRKMIKNMNNLKFLTLTLKYDNLNMDYSERITKLWEYRKRLFRKLREGVTYIDKHGNEVQEKYFIGTWMATIELPNHMHIIMDSDYLPHRIVQAEWERITEDSFIVDIRPVKEDVRDTRALAVWYITKYLTKLSEIPYETTLLLKGFHLVGSHTMDRAGGQPERKYKKIDRYQYIAIYYDHYPWKFHEDHIERVKQQIDAIASLWRIKNNEETFKTWINIPRTWEDT